MVALPEPSRLCHLTPLACDVDPAAIGAELLRSRHMLGDAPVAPAKVLPLFVRVHGRHEFEVESKTGLVGLQHQPMPAQPLDNFDLKRTDDRLQGIGPKPS